MNNEPVAWTNADCLEMVKEDGESNMWWMPDLAEDIPLYLHPAKTLTDEEIRTAKDELNIKNDKYSWDFPYMDFARALLKKASDK
jgi:hypothetical protein